jgi:hypothetical protein
MLVDGPLVVNEVVNLAQKSKKECMIFKVNFEKARDSVSWSFLDYLLGRFDFGSKWRGWMKACVFSGSLLCQ